MFFTQRCFPLGELVLGVSPVCEESSAAAEGGGREKIRQDDKAETSLETIFPNTEKLEHIQEWNLQKYANKHFNQGNAHINMYFHEVKKLQGLLASALENNRARWLLKV